MNYKLMLRDDLNRKDEMFSFSFTNIIRLSWAENCMTLLQTARSENVAADARPVPTPAVFYIHILRV